MFKGTLYGEQKPAAEFLCNRKRVLLAWEQGTGKTIISLASVDKLFELGKAKRALILADSSAWQWEDKIQEFTNLDYTYTTAKDKQARQYSKTNNRVYIVPYSVYRRDYGRIHEIPWDIVITDEAQEFANTKGKTRKLVLLFNRLQDPRYRWALTGTAISNKLEELYSILYWVDKLFLPPWPEFEERHIIRDSFKRITGYKNLAELHEYLKYRVSRKTHKDMAGYLPKLLPKVHLLDKTKDYEKKEQTLVKYLDESIENLTFTKEGTPKGFKRSKKATRAFHVVRQSLAEPKLKFAERLVTDILDENSANKCIVFSFYKEPLYTLDSRLVSHGILGSFYTGDQEGDKKRDSIREFETETRVLYASKAAEKALDLPFANYAIHLDIPFSFGSVDQRNKRITRVASKFQSVVVNYLIIQDSFEHYFFNQVKRKGLLQEAVLEGGADTVEIKTESLRQFLKQ